VSGIGDALAVHRPNLVVLAGGFLGDDDVARWAYQVRLSAGAMPVAVYRRGAQRVRMRTTGTSVLPNGAGDAHRQLLELLEGESTATAPFAPIGGRRGARLVDGQGPGVQRTAAGQ
jgi:hypothetical protein